MDETTLTPINPENARVVERMTELAMCSYANWQEAVKSYEAAREAGHYDGGRNAEARVIALTYQDSQRAEYRAASRCLAMLVRQHYHTVLHAVATESARRYHLEPSARAAGNDTQEA